MISKQPCIILAPHITPYFFTIQKICVSDKVPVEMVNGKKMKTLPCYTRSRVSGARDVAHTQTTPTTMNHQTSSRAMKYQQLASVMKRKYGRV